MKIQRRLFLRNFITVFVIVSAVIAPLAYMEVINEFNNRKIREFGSVLLRVKSIENNLAPVIADLSVLVSHHYLREYLNTGSEESKQKLQAEFLLGSTIKTYYDQIRYINKDGMEIVRVNYNNGNPVIVSEDQLQSKKDRYYFRETLTLNKGKIYASPFDLNVEGGKVEYPVKPMIRIGLPVFDQLGIKKGIVIINYRGDLLLKEFAQNVMLDNTVILSEGQFWLINSEGFWLKGPDPEKEWAFMYDGKEELSFSNEYSKEWDTILSTNDGQLHGTNGLFTYSTIFPFSKNPDIENNKTNSKNIDNYKWKVISFIPDSILTANAMGLLWKYIIIFIFINLLSLIGNLLLVTASSKSAESEEKLKSLLERRTTLQSLLLKVYQSEYKDLTSGLKELVNAAYEFLEVDYVSVWRMSKDSTLITCMDIPADPNIYPFTDVTIDFEKFPEYFKTVLIGNQIVADDVFEHNATKGFKNNYLIPDGVRSILDSPIWNHGKIMGIFALARRRERKNWTIEEQNFATQIASAIAAMIETNERIEAEKKMKDAVREAENAKRTKSEFLANMSHEIRTPMNAILGFSELLLDKTQEGEDREFLQSINSSGKTLLYLINDILDLSKIESGKMEIVNQPVKIKPLIDDMKQLFSQRARENNLDFIIEISQIIPDILIIDGVRLRQILLNVIGNAVKFTDKGFVKISLDSQTFQENTDLFSLVISIEDSGIGIPKESREKVFDPFEQTGKGSLAKYGGTGLGLAITKRLLKLMNGSIDIVNKESPGTIFRITLFDVKTGFSGSNKSIDDE